MRREGAVRIPTRVLTYPLQLATIVVDRGARSGTRSVRHPGPEAGARGETQP